MGERVARKPRSKAVKVSPEVAARTSPTTQAAAAKTVSKANKINPKSMAWKDLERRVATLFNEAGFSQAFRETRGGDLGESTFDVKVPELPQLINDGKYTQKTHTIHTMWRKALDLYAAEARLASGGMNPETIIWSQEKNKNLILATLDGRYLMKLIAGFYLREGQQDADAWQCPRCGGGLDSVEAPMGRDLHTCQECGLQFETESGRRNTK